MDHNEKKMMYLIPKTMNDPLPLIKCCSDDGNLINMNDILSGKPYGKNSMRLKIENGEPYSSDLILAFPGLTPLISNRLAGAIQKENFQYGEFISINDEYYSDYSVINIYPFIDIMDYEKSKFIEVGQNRTYYECKVRDSPSFEGFFRILRFSSSVLITNRVYQFLRNFSLIGIDFLSV